MPRPWPKITAQSAPDGDGGINYSRNGDTLNVFQTDAEVTVKPGDSLSKYSMILYGSYRHLDVFARPTRPNGIPKTATDTIRIVNQNLIKVGEKLYHLPTLDENAARSSSNQPPAWWGENDTPLNENPAPDVALPPGIEIIAYDHYDTAAFGEYWTTFGTKVLFDNVQSFVRGVLRESRGAKINLLHIQAHGDSTTIHFGDTGLELSSFRYPFGSPNGDKVTQATFENFRSEFIKLTPCFAPGAWVVLRSCETGWAQILLRQFRRLWGVNILAGKGKWNNKIDYNNGSYVIFDSAGNEYLTNSLPWALQHDTLRATGWRDNPLW